jgi:hypothetical protein
MAKVVSRQHLQISNGHYQGGQRDQSRERVLGASGVLYVGTEAVAEPPEVQLICVTQRTCNENKHAEAAAADAHVSGMWMWMRAYARVKTHDKQVWYGLVWYADVSRLCPNSCTCQVV